ncbi:MAG: prepilin peptidase [Acidimicrobiia bacterium]|nr:prepilin peptidase [Acidimicrobiia bacterium]
MNVSIDSLNSDQWLYVWVFLSALFGLAIGSFLNVVIWRVPLNMSLIKGGSICPKCRKEISAKENIPLFSYIFLRGKCKNCKAKISKQYPAVELLTSIVWVITTWRIGLHLYTFGFLIFFTGLIALSTIDIKTKLLPNKIVYPTGIIFVVIISSWAIATNNIEILRNCLIVGIIYFLFLFAIWFASNGKAMGFGDVRLSFFLGFAMGFYGFMISYAGMLLSFILGAVIGIFIATLTKSGRKMKIPFGPFLASGTIIVIWCASMLSHIIELPNV